MPSAPLPEVLRTPDDTFRDLPGFDFAPHYLSDLAGVEGIRVHYLDEGAADAKSTVLCLHGQPTWSYLYRNMIPAFVGAGYRVVAPDWIGFGRSDKPADDGFYTYSRHRDMLLRFIERLDLRNVTLVVQDWGGLLGLTVPMAMPERFSRLLVMNTGLATGEVPLGEGFLAWRAYANQHPDLDIAALMKRSTAHLSDAEAKAYAAPFPDARYKAGVRCFPNLVPDKPQMDGAALSRQALHWWHQEWAGKSFMAIGMKDPVLGPPAMRSLQRVIKGCPAPLELAEAGHFVQEWAGEFMPQALAALALEA